MISPDLLLFVPSLFALVCLFARRNLFCMYLAILVWLQSVVVTASHQPMFGATARERISFVAILVLVMSFAVILSFVLRKRRRDW